MLLGMQKDTYPSTNEQPKLRAAVYLRVSTDEQTEKFWAELQRSSVENYVKARSSNLELAGEEYIYRDLPISGTAAIEERPWLSQLFYDLDNGKDLKPFDVVIVYKIDRFARKLSLLLDIVDELGKFKASFISTQESIDTSHPFGKAMLGILWVFAELERDTIQERTWDGRQISKTKGTVMSDVYGYIRDSKSKRPTIYKPEAEIVETIFDLYVNARFTPNEIAQQLQKDKILIPASSSKPWKEANLNVQDIYKRWDKTIRSILSNEMYIGKLYYDKTQTIIDESTGKKKQLRLPKEEWQLSEYTHEPIIDEAIFLDAQKFLSKKLAYTRAKEEDYLLSWLIYCDSCKDFRARGPVKWVGVTNNRSKYYQCSWKNSQKHTHRCKVLPLWKNELESVVCDFIKEVINRPDVIEKYIHETKAFKKFDAQQKKRRSWLIDRINRLDDWLDRLHDLYTRAEITHEEYNKRSKETKKDLLSHKEELKSIDTKIKDNKDPRYYAGVFEIVKEMIGSNIDKTFADPLKLKRLLQSVIKQVVIYSRDKKEGDVIRAKAVKGVQVPYRLNIVFNLPAELFDGLYVSSDIMLPTSWDGTNWKRKPGKKKESWQRVDSSKKPKKQSSMSLGISDYSIIHRFVNEHRKSNSKEVFSTYLFRSAPPH